MSKDHKADQTPASWSTLSLGAFVSLRRGHDLTWRDRKDGTIPVMGAGGQNGWHSVEIDKGPGVILGRSGASFGQAYFVAGPYWPHNTALYVTCFNDNDPKFVYYYLYHLDFSRHNSGGAQQSLNRNFIAPIKVIVPSVDEQRDIATALSDVDALLEELDRLIAKKRDIKQAAMQQLLTGETRLPGFEGEWEAKCLGNIAELHRLNVIPANQPEQLFVHFSLPAFDEGQMATVELGAAIGSNKFRVPNTSILVSKLNPRIPRIWMPEIIPPNSCASTEWLILTPQECVERMFLFVLCSSQAFCQQMEMAATGTTGSHQRISPSMALDIQVGVPVDREEQTAIAKVLYDMDAEIQALEQRRSKTAELKQGMMQELLTGRTRLV